MDQFFPPNADPSFKTTLTIVMFMPVVIPVLWFGVLGIRDLVRFLRARKVDSRREEYRNSGDE